MFITMNRFKIKPGSEQDFIDIWTGRDSYLGAVPGFQGLHLLQGASSEAHTLFSSHVTWASKKAYEAWRKSDAFKQAHADAGSRQEIYLGPPELEYFDVVL